MKNRTLFYKFNGKRQIWDATVHSSFIEKEINEEEEITTIQELLNNVKAIIENLNKVNASIDKYYEEKREKKFQFIKKTNQEELNNFIEKIEETDKYILRLDFSKALKEEEIDIICTLLWVHLFKIANFDSSLEIYFWRKKELIKTLEVLILEEAKLIEEKIEGVNKILLKIVNVSIDSNNRNVLEHSLEELNQTKILRLIFNKNWIRNRNNYDFSLLDNLYSLFKEESSRIIAKRSEDVEDLYVSFIVENVQDVFKEGVITLLDSLVDIECLDVKENNNMSQLSLWQEILSNPPEEGTEYGKVCVVDYKVSDQGPLSWWVEYGKVFDWPSITSKHGTNVSSLALYGKIDETTTVLEKPTYKIFSLESNYYTYTNITDILEEAEKNGCFMVNISQGLDQILKDNDGISEIAKDIDEFLTNKELLLILSAGNISKDCPTTYEELIQEKYNINIPKDSISSLVIGAKSNDNSMCLYSRKNNIDSEISVWKTPGYLVRLRDHKKPNFIEYGDNYVYDGINNWIAGKGTSFAAPLALRKAAKVYNEFGGGISINTIKALFTNYADGEHLLPLKYSALVPDSARRRHIWRGCVDIDYMLNEESKVVNIIIEDFISNWEQKKYFLLLPEIEKGKNIIMKRAISYNPPISRNFIGKYCKFCVSSQIWCPTYQKFFDQCFSQEDIGDIKKRKIRNDFKKGRPLRWVNYFWPTNMWSPDTQRVDPITEELYSELREGTEIIINGHSRGNIDFTQKFSFVLTLDLKEINNLDDFISNLLQLNEELFLGNNNEELSQNIEEKEKYFEENQDIYVDIESIW